MTHNEILKRYYVRGQLREVHKITQWKDGCVYRTKPLGYIVCASEQFPLRDSKVAQLASPSTRLHQELSNVKLV